MLQTSPGLYGAHGAPHVSQLQIPGCSTFRLSLRPPRVERPSGRPFPVKAETSGNDVAATPSLSSASAPASTSTSTIRPPVSQPAPSAVKPDGVAGSVQWKGTVLLEKLNMLDLNNLVADLGDRFSELFGSRVNLQLVSEQIDPETAKGKRSEKASLQNWFLTLSGLTADAGTEYSVSFTVGKDFGRPGAILVENGHPNPFLLKRLKLEAAGEDPIIFAPNSWVYQPSVSGGPRIFFSSQRFLPGQTPSGLADLREQELENLRGNGEGERISTDRIYDYDVYNDLGKPDKSVEYARTTLGGSEDFPYPRRCRTGRAKTLSEPTQEQSLTPVDTIYVPRDEQFDRLKTAGFLGSSLKAVLHAVLPGIRMLLSGSSDFKSFKAVEALYDRNTIELAREATRKKIKQLEAEKSEAGKGRARPSSQGFDLLREITDPSGGDPSVFTFPVPQIIQVDQRMWTDDSEFGRQLLAGVNPMSIERLQVFPPTSTLDPEKYGPAVSSITEDHIKPFLEGMSAQEALDKKKLYILDYHDTFMPYVERINQLKGKTYAARALFLLTKEDVLRPIAIELSLPPSTDGKEPAKSRVLVPPSLGKADTFWNLAKTHVATLDAGFHQLVSHWLRTHACIEPFIIATNRQLSAMHPIHSFLVPHFKNTMTINSMARNDLINCYSGSIFGGGIIEYGFFPGKYASELSSVAYKGWKFSEQGLPADLIKRGMAEADPSAKHGVRLLIEDYPYAVDGLEVWGALREWVCEYLRIFYKDDKAVAADAELQAWWTELREKGHADKAGEDWWPELSSVETLADVLTTLTWITSCHHAAVNFGQFAYGGFPVSRPTMARQLVPEEGTEEYEEMRRDPEGFYMKLIPSALQCLIVVATLEILSTHADNEEYLGFPALTDGAEHNPAVAHAVQRLRERLRVTDEAILARNCDTALFNRYGKANIPYTLLLATSLDGLTGRGVPKSISI